jgi:hypothetical protein
MDEIKSFINENKQDNNSNDKEIPLDKFEDNKIPPNKIDNFISFKINLLKPGITSFLLLYKNKEKKYKKEK